LPVYGVVRSDSELQPKDKLKEYETSKKHRDRNIEIIPEDTFRMRSEDKFAEKEPAHPPPALSDDST